MSKVFEYIPKTLFNLYVEKRMIGRRPIPELPVVSKYSNQIAYGEFYASQGSKVSVQMEERFNFWLEENHWFLF